MSNLKTVKTKDGKTVTQCGYRWVTPDGEVVDCHSAASCPICGQCSKIQGDAEHGHCTGHLGLSEHIPYPGNVPARS